MNTNQNTQQMYSDEYIDMFEDEYDPDNNDSIKSYQQEEDVLDNKDNYNEEDEESTQKIDEVKPGVVENLFKYSNTNEINQGQMHFDSNLREENTIKSRLDFGINEKKVNTNAKLLTLNATRKTHNDNQEFINDRKDTRLLTSNSLEKKGDQVFENSIKQLELNYRKKERSNKSKIACELIESHNFGANNMEYNDYHQQLFGRTFPNEVYLEQNNSHNVMTQVEKGKSSLKLTKISKKNTNKDNLLLNKPYEISEIEQERDYYIQMKENIGYKNGEMEIGNYKKTKIERETKQINPIIIANDKLNYLGHYRPAIDNSRFNIILENSKRILMELKEVSNDRSKSLAQLNTNNSNNFGGNYNLYNHSLERPRIDPDFKHIYNMNILTNIISKQSSNLYTNTHFPSSLENIKTSFAIDSPNLTGNYISLKSNQLPYYQTLPTISQYQSPMSTSTGVNYLAPIQNNNLLISNSINAIRNNSITPIKKDFILEKKDSISHEKNCFLEIQSLKFPKKNLVQNEVTKMDNVEINSESNQLKFITQDHIPLNNQTVKINEDILKDDSRNQRLRIEPKKFFDKKPQKIAVKAGVEQRRQKNIKEINVINDVKKEKVLDIANLQNYVNIDNNNEEAVSQAKEVKTYNLRSEAEEDIINENKEYCHVICEIDFQSNNNDDIHHENENIKGNTADSNSNQQDLENILSSAEFENKEEIKNEENNQEINQINNENQMNLARMESNDSLNDEEMNIQNEQENYIIINNNTEYEDEKRAPIHFSILEVDKKYNQHENRLESEESLFRAEDFEEKYENITNFKVISFKSGEMFDDNSTPQKKIENDEEKVEMRLFFESRSIADEEKKSKKDCLPKKYSTQKSTSNLKTVSLNLEDSNHINQIDDKKDDYLPVLESAKPKLKLITDNGVNSNGYYKSNAPHKLLQTMTQNNISTSLVNVRKTPDLFSNEANEQSVKGLKKKVDDKLLNGVSSPKQTLSKQELTSKEDEKKDIQNYRPKLQLVDNFGKVSLSTMNVLNEKKPNLILNYEKVKTNETNHLNSLWDTLEPQVESTKSPIFSNKQTLLANIDKNTIQNNFNKSILADNNNTLNNSKGQKIKLELVESKKAVQKSSSNLMSNIIKKTQDYISGKENTKLGYYEDGIVSPKNTIMKFQNIK